jgi:hypothetical protein
MLLLRIVDTSPSDPGIMRTVAVSLVEVRLLDCPRGPSVAVIEKGLP